MVVGGECVVSGICFVAVGLEWRMVSAETPTPSIAPKLHLQPPPPTPPPPASRTQRASARRSVLPVKSRKTGPRTRRLGTSARLKRARAPEYRASWSCESRGVVEDGAGDERREGEVSWGMGVCGMIARAETGREVRCTVLWGSWREWWTWSRVGDGAWTWDAEEFGWLPWYRTGRNGSDI